MNWLTSIHCFDGRIQRPILDFLEQRYGDLPVDVITEPGAVRVLTTNHDRRTFDAVMAKLKFSIERRDPGIVVVAGHHDCLGNPIPDYEHRDQVGRARDLIRGMYPDRTVLSLWVDAQGRAIEI